MAPRLSHSASGSPPATAAPRPPPSLPAEIMAKIFSFLPDRNDIAAARLVCKDYCTNSSEFLLNELVFAWDVDTIRRFQAIINDRLFGRHITTLVIDCSTYDEDVVNDRRLYNNQYESFINRSIDPWAQRVASDLAALDDLGCTEPADGEIEGWVQANLDTRTDERAWARNADQWGEATYPDYLRRYRALDILLNNGIREELISEAFQKCPKLRRVVITDYRGRARKGESYAELCLRLFGTRLPPDDLSVIGNMFAVREVIMAVDFLPDARLDSFIIGRHPFSSIKPMLAENYDTSLLAPEVFYDGGRFDSAGGPNAFDADTCTEAFQSLRTLSLTYHDRRGSSYTGTMPENIWYMLSAARQTLRHLSITLAGDLLVAPHLNAEFIYPEKSDFLALKFDFLQSVEFRHLRLPNVDNLRGFLNRHKDTLREVRLVDCIQDGGKTGIDIAADLATWGRDNLKLTGIESIHKVDLDRLVIAQPGETDENNWTLITSPSPEAALRRVERLEEVWIHHRANSLQRSVDVADRAERAKDHIGWWLRPAL